MSDSHNGEYDEKRCPKCGGEPRLHIPSPYSLCAACGFMFDTTPRAKSDAEEYDKGNVAELVDARESGAGGSAKAAGHAGSNPAVPTLPSELESLIGDPLREWRK